MKPTDVSERIDLLDYLRGFALLGIILVNILSLLSVKPPAPYSVDAAYQQLLFLFVEGRFYAIFAFLFGMGMYLFISRADKKRYNGYLLFLRRIIVLFLFGFIHLIFQPGEALTVYASCGLLILPFYKFRKEMNLIISTVLLVITAFFPLKILMTFPLVLLGLTAGQYQWFEGIPQKVKRLIPITVFLFMLSAVGIIIQVQHHTLRQIDLHNQSPLTNRFLRIGIMIGPILSFFYISFLTLILNNRLIQKIFTPLKSYGRMALTNYLMQTAFILIAEHIFHLYKHISYLQTLYLCVAIYVIQLLFSMIWLHFFRFGPLEWVWRLFTYIEKPQK